MTSQYAFKSNVHKHIINWKAGAVFAIKWSNLITNTCKPNFRKASLSLRFFGGII